jgi:hypothetical protein
MTDLNALESLYFAALEKPLAERPAFLDAACCGDHDLRTRVERLLAAQPKVRGFLDAPVATPDLPAAGATATFDSYAPATASFPGNDERVGSILAGKWPSISLLLVLASQRQGSGLPMLARLPSMNFRWSSM